jgi:Arc/MetJ-type ribon-helix-helix transcriptional regulator
MATKKYKVTLPEELAEAIREKVGPGAFSAYVTEAVRRQFENDRLGELVDWMMEGQEPFTEAELAAGDAEFREFERFFAERDRRERASSEDKVQKSADALQVTETANTAKIDMTSDTDEGEADHPLAA